MAKQSKSTLDTALDAIRKDMGPSSVFNLGDNPMETERLSSGVYSLDHALGGGYGRGAFVELSGPPGGGKSALALKIAAEAQKLGENVAYLDLEHGMNPQLATKCGVNVNSLLFSQPNSGEQGLDITDRLLRAGVEVIIIDSVGAMTPQAEINGDYGDALVGARARMVSQGVNKLTAAMNENQSKTILVWINQIRDKIGGFGHGPTTTTPGGHALRHAHSVRATVSRIGSVKKADAVVGHEVKVHITKNRFYVPFREANFDILYHADGGGFDESSVVKLAKKHKLIELNGSWHLNTLTGEKFGNGYLAAVDHLIAHPDELADLKVALTGILSS